MHVGVPCILFHARYHEHIFTEGFGRDDYGHVVRCVKCDPPPQEKRLRVSDLIQRIAEQEAERADYLWERLREARALVRDLTRALSAERVEVERLRDEAAKLKAKPLDESTKRVR